MVSDDFDVATLRELSLKSEGLGESLESLYHRSLNHFKLLDSCEYHPKSRQYRIFHGECLEILCQCLEKSEKLGIFSPNEELDDIATSRLKYLNLNFFAAKVIERTPIDTSETSVDGRMSVIQLAARRYVEFLYLLDNYKKFKSPQTSKILSIALPNGIHGRFNLTGLSAFQKERQRDREFKIEYFKKIHQLELRYEDANSLLLGSSVDEEEKYREAEMCRIELHQVKTVECIISCVDELSMLSTMGVGYGIAPLQERSTPYVPSPHLSEYAVQCLNRSSNSAKFDDIRIKEEERAGSREDMSTKVERLPNSSQLVDENGRILRPFVIKPDCSSSNFEQKRAEILGNVYGTGQVLPTVTVEQLIEKELANSIPPRIPPADREELEKSYKNDEDSYSVSDALTMKARQWDDFTESVAKGSGNTLNLG